MAINFIAVNRDWIRKLYVRVVWTITALVVLLAIINFAVDNQLVRWAILGTQISCTCFQIALTVLYFKIMKLGYQNSYSTLDKSVELDNDPSRKTLENKEIHHGKK